MQFLPVAGAHQDIYAWTSHHVVKNQAYGRSVVWIFQQAT